MVALEQQRQLAKGVARHARSRVEDSRGVVSGYFIRRMRWSQRDGRWHGEWYWEAYDRVREWDQQAWPKVNRRWRDMGKNLGLTDLHPTYQFAQVSNAGIIPQEVLLGMVHRLRSVSVIG